MAKLVKGNEAVVYGAALAGCTSYYGYPITPASEIAHTAAAIFPKLGRTFLQAESETAAVNMVYGAAAAGERTMTASSGPGISLKAEGISYLAAAELPCVIVDIMRGGPGLGNIGPDQSDYNQIVKGGGHGNYRLITLVPNSAQEMCDMAIRAFELADRYRNPAVVLTDGVIGQMMEAVEFPQPAPPAPDKPWAASGDAAHQGSCHSSIYLDHDELEAHNLHLLGKYRKIEECEQDFEAYRTDDADVVVVGYGVISRVCRSVVDALRDEGIRAGLFRPKLVWPFPSKGLLDLASRVEHLVVAEMSMGMLIDDVRLTLNDGRDVGLVTSYGGKLPSFRELKEALRQRVEGQ